MPAATDLQRLYDEHAQALFAFLLNFTRDENDTRDLLQEIFTRLAREPGLLRGAREERAFLIRLAHNAAIDLMRRRGARQKYHDQFAEDAIPFSPSPESRRNGLSRIAFRARCRIARPTNALSCTSKLWENLTFEQIAERSTFHQTPRPAGIATA